MDNSATNIKELDFLSKVKKRWTEKDLSSLQSSIVNNTCVEEIAEQLNRTVPAVISRANKLGYGYSTVQGLKYFNENINHKNRRTREEMQEGKEFVPVESKDSLVTDSESTDKKTILNLNFSIELQITVKMKSSGGGLNDLLEKLTPKDIYVSK